MRAAQGQGCHHSRERQQETVITSEMRSNAAVRGRMLKECMRPSLSSRASRADTTREYWATDAGPPAPGHRPSALLCTLLRQSACRSCGNQRQERQPPRALMPRVAAGALARLLGLVPP